MRVEFIDFAEIDKICSAEIWRNWLHGTILRNGKSEERKTRAISEGCALDDVHFKTIQLEFEHFIERSSNIRFESDVKCFSAYKLDEF